jgi:hypothetical protein
VIYRQLGLAYAHEPGDTTAAMRNLAERISERAAQLDTSRVDGVVLEHRASTAIADLRRIADEVDALLREWEVKA